MQSMDDDICSNQEMIRAPSSRSPSPPSQRIRVSQSSQPFIWQRFKNSYPIDEFKPIKITESPDVRILEDMINYSGDLTEIRDNRPRLLNYVASIRRGGMSKDAIYEQINYSAYRPEDYNGASKIGRSFTKSYLQHMPSRIIKSLFRGTHFELDIKMCYPVLCSQLFHFIDIPTIRAYAREGNACMEEFRELFGVSIKSMKTLVCATICSGGMWPTLPADISRGINSSQVMEHSWIKGLVKDSESMVKAIKTYYPEFYEFCSNIREGNQKHKGDENVGKTAISMMLSDAEHLIMRNVIQHLFPDGVIENVVWKHDGLILPRSILGESSPDEFAVSMGQLIMRTIGLEVTFVIKDLSEGSIPLAMSRSELESRDPYLEWKRDFERNHFFVITAVKYARVGADRKPQLMSETAFKTYTNTQRAMRERWIQDPHQRQYERLGFYPPPSVCPDDVYNLWTGFAAEDLPENVNSPDLSIWHKHLKLLCGGNRQGAKESYEYFDNTIAHLFQKPGEKTGVMQLFVSAQGTGKDLMADFLVRAMGVGVTVRAGTLDEVIGPKKFGMIEGKILCVVSETDQADMKKVGASSLKTTITESSVMVDTKYEAIRVSQNICNFIVFSNSSTPMQLDDGERRIHVMQTEGFYAGKIEYFEPLVKACRDDGFIRGLYDYYMDKDISNFDPRRRPVTEAHANMVQFTSDIFKTFLSNSIGIFEERGLLKDDRVFIRQDDFLGEYVIYANMNKYHADETEGQIKRKVRKMIADINMKLDRFKSSEDDPPVIIYPDRDGSIINGIGHKFHGIKHISMNIGALKKALGGGCIQDSDIVLNNMAMGFQPGRNN